MKAEAQEEEKTIVITSFTENKSLDEDAATQQSMEYNVLIFVKCFACSFETNNELLLKRHTIDHFDDLLDCTECSFKTNRRKTLNLHVSKHTRTSNLFACVKCDYESFSLNKLKIHKCKKESKVYRRYRCFLCKQVSFSRPNLRLHLKSHDRDILTTVKYKHPVKSSMARVPVVQESFHSNLLPNAENLETQARKLVVCPLCNYKCYHKNELRVHVLDHLAEQFNCLECDFGTHSEMNFNMHMQSHNDDRYSDNDYESDSENNVSNLSLDLSRIHRETKLHNCSKCNFSTNDQEKLKTHFVKHLVVVKCSKCNYKTNLNRRLKDHYKRNHPNIQKVNRTKNAVLNTHSDIESSELMCKRCRYVAADEEELKIHKRGHYKVEMLKCTECDFVTSKRFYNKHLITHKYIKLHRCPLCPYGSNKSAHLKRHLEIMHSNAEMLKCPKCEFETRNKWDLRCHVLSHAKKVVTCPICGFLTKARYYKKHLMKHSDARFFKCSMCSYEAKVISHLKTHISLMHPEAVWHNCQKCKFQTLDEGELESHYSLKHSKMKCPECNYETNNRTRFRSHILTHSRRFECSKCDYFSNHRGHLNMHLRTHATPRILRCPTCNYSSSQRSHMTRHLRIHSVLKLVKCPQCDFRTKSKEYLKAHMLTHIEPKMLSCLQCPYATNRKHLLKRHVLTHSKVKKA